MASGALKRANLWLLSSHSQDLLYHCRTGSGDRGSAEIRNTSVSRSVGEADTLDLAHALANYYGRKVVVVGTDDHEVVVEPRAERRLDS